MVYFIGPFLGVIVFLFTYIASKKSGNYYLAPVITFSLAFVMTAFSIIVVRGWEGMAFFMVAAGVFIVSFLGTIALPFITRNKKAQPYSKADKISLTVLPIILFVGFGSLIYFDKGYWIIDQGEWQFESEQSLYEVKTIFEGRKQVFLRLGNEYRGKKIEIDKISKWGPTTITVNIIEGENESEVPYIKIGLDRIRQPLTVQTNDGVVFKQYEYK